MKTPLSIDQLTSAAAPLRAWAWTLPVLLAACASPVVPPSALPALARQHAATASPAASEQGIATGTPSAAWWRALNDTGLDQLVQAADAANPGAQAAAQAVAAARAQWEAAEREAWPQGRLTADAQAVRPAVADVDPFNAGSPRPPQRRLLTVMQGVSWELDLFGRIATAAGVAARDLDMALAQAHAVRAALHGDVVRHYVALRWHQQALASLQREQQAMAERVRLLTARHAAGLLDQRELLSAQSEATGVQAELAGTRQRLTAHRHALAVLAGQSPRAPADGLAGLAQPADLPPVPATADLRQPADLLVRRPDVAWADAQFRARVGEAVLADRANWPRLILNFGIGVSAVPGQLGQASALRYSAGPALSMDWLDAGRHRARAAAARAGQQAAWHRFEDTVLRALQDGEDALQGWAAAREAMAQAGLARQSAVQAEQHASRRVAAGLEAPGASLDGAVNAERALRRAVSAQADALLAYVQVQLALGAWQPPT
ncbi:MAG: TolC family protein [Burkholderiales bacterium]|nr:MAG: TolC family protein [Burkholderiales bacterium]